MSLGIRKLVVVGLVALVLMLANAMVLAHWLSQTGLIDGAGFVCREFFTGTALTIIVVLLILLVPARAATQASAWIRRCSVCDHLLLRQGKYCPECGSILSKAAG